MESLTGGKHWLISVSTETRRFCFNQSQERVMCKCTEYKEHIIKFGCAIKDHGDQAGFFFFSLSLFLLWTPLSGFACADSSSRASASLSDSFLIWKCLNAASGSWLHSPCPENRAKNKRNRPCLCLFGPLHSGLL